MEFQVFSSHFEDHLDCSTMSPLPAFNSSQLSGLQQFENGKQQKEVPGSDNVRAQRCSGSTCEQPGAPQRLEGTASAGSDSWKDKAKEKLPHYFPE